MSKFSKKVFAAVLSAVLLSVAIPTNTFALNEEYKAELIYPIYENDSGISAASLDEQFYSEEFEDYLIEQFKTCPESVDVLQFGIDSADANELANIIWKEIPQLFHINGIGYSVNSSCVSRLYVDYYEGLATAADYQSHLAQMESAASGLLIGIENNSELSDVEKALLLHDRLCLWNEYDYNIENVQLFDKETYSAYGAFVKRTSVCEGYAKAYDYLLSRVGIKSRYCSSRQMNHGWNIVYIDNIPYHVDATHDDCFNIAGKFSHENFLVSTEKYKSNSTQHNATDFNSTPTDTRYEGYCWQNSLTAFQLINNEIYYMDNADYSVKKMSGSGGIEVCDASSFWYYSYTGYPKSQSCLASVGNELLFSLDDGVYSYNLDTSVKTKIFTPNGMGEYNLIYGFGYENGNLICQLSEDLQSFTVQKTFYLPVQPDTDVLTVSGVTIKSAENTLYYLVEKSVMDANGYTNLYITGNYNGTEFTQTQYSDVDGYYCFEVTDVAFGNKSLQISVSVNAKFYGVDFSGNVKQNTVGMILEVLGSSVTVGKSDFDRDFALTSDDAVYLLYSTLYGEADFPSNGQNRDCNGDGQVTSDDAVYLLYHTLFSDIYPVG